MKSEDQDLQRLVWDFTWQELVLRLERLCHLLWERLRYYITEYMYIYVLFSANSSYSLFILIYLHCKQSLYISIL